MQIDLSYFIIYKSHILSVTDEKTCEEFIAWAKENGSYIRMPWGDLFCSVEGYVTEDEDFELQEEVFSDCSLEFQNIIYKLKQIQLKEKPNSNAELVIE